MTHFREIAGAGAVECPGRHHGGTENCGRRGMTLSVAMARLQEGLGGKPLDALESYMRLRKQTESMKTEKAMET